MKTPIVAVWCFAAACVFLAVNASLYAQGTAPGGPHAGPPAGSPPNQGGFGPPGAGGPAGSPPNQGGFGPPGAGRPAGSPPAGVRQPNASAGAGRDVQLGPVSRWWDDKTTAKTVGLSSEQKRKMDAIFDAGKPAILAAFQDFLKEQASLEAISKDPHAGKETTFAAIDAVNRARAALEKATAQMSLEIREQLNQDQLNRVEQLH